MREFDEIPVIGAAKRLGVQWCPWMDDWFTSWSPRNDNNNAEGTWEEWANLAARILAHPFTEKVTPELYHPELLDGLPHLYTTGQTLTEVGIRAVLANGGTT